MKYLGYLGFGLIGFSLVWWYGDTADDAEIRGNRHLFFVFLCSNKASLLPEKPIHIAHIVDGSNILFLDHPIYSSW